MIIGAPKEIKEQEQRVALLPSGTTQLTKHGHSVLVERNAGFGSGYSDEDYVKAGAEIVEQAKEVFARADMIVKVKEPLKAEFPLLRRGQILFTYLHLAASKSLTEALLKSGVTGVAYETISVDHRLPLLEPMSEIAGRMSVVMGANFLAKYNGGSGVLLGGVPGVLPGRVVILGGGTSGVNALRMARGLGADVTILDVDVERLGDAFEDVLAPAPHAAQWPDDRDGAVVEAERRIGDHQVGIERIARAETVAVETHAVRTVEAEQLRRRWFVALVAMGAGIMGRQDNVFMLGESAA